MFYNSCGCCVGDDEEEGAEDEDGEGAELEEVELIVLQCSRHLCVEMRVLSLYFHLEC